MTSRGTSPDELARVVPYSRFLLRLERTAFPLYEPPSDCRNPGAAARFLHRLMESEPHEALGALFLDGHDRAIGHAIPFRGSLDCVPCSPAGIFGPAILANAASLILFHNHPSREPHPSAADVAATKRMAQAGALLGIPVRDHIVLGEPPRYTSLAVRGEIGDYSAFAASLEGELALRRDRDRRQEVLPKYRDPETGATWAGRGTMARWLRERLAAGAKLEDFLRRPEEPRS